MAYSFASVEEVIEEVRQGQFIIIMDDEDRENEGDLVIPAEKVTPDHINFMAKFGRGMICLAIEQELANKLKLNIQERRYTSDIDSAFTTTIDARYGITTGISAYDRAKTILDAVNPKNTFEHIKTPGHIFPIVAKKGGLLERPGHTEASVTVSKLAGLHPSGVVCEIMKDDGTMARRDDIFKFASYHGLKVTTIEKLKKQL